MDLQKLASCEKKILLNNWELILEANCLFDAGYYPRAYSLAHISIEENAKQTVLLYVAMDLFSGKEIGFVDLEAIFSGPLFTNHILKLRTAFLLFPGYDYQTTVKQTKSLNQLKNKSIYADVLNGTIYKPSDFFGREQASSMIEIAKNMLKRRLDEIGIDDPNHLPTLDVSIIEDRYEKLRQVFGMMNEVLGTDTDVSYADYLLKIVKDQELFDGMKRLFLRRLNNTGT